MALDRYEERPVVGPLGHFDVSAGQRAQADMFGQVAQVIDKVQDVAYEELANDAAVQGKLAGAKDAVQLDENGKLLPLTTLPDDFTIYGQAFREAAILNYRQAAEGDAALKADEIGRQYADDPEGFRTAWNNYTKETSGVLHPEVAGELTPYFHRIGAQKFGLLADEKATRERQGAIDGFNNAIDTKFREILHVADNFSLTPNTFVQIETMIQTEIVPLMQRIREINPDFSPAEGDEMIRQYRLGAVKRALMHDAADTALGSQVAIGGVARPNTDVSDRYLNSLVENPPEALAAIASPEEIQAMVNDARAWVDLRVSETSVQRQQAAEGVRLRDAQTINSWAEKVDQAAGNSELLAKLYLDADTAKFSGDPVSDEATRGHIKATIRDQQASIVKEQAKQQPVYDLLNDSLVNNRPLPNTPDGRKAADLAADFNAKQNGVAVTELYDPYSSDGRVAITNFAKQFGQLPSNVSDAFSNATALTDPEQIKELAYTYNDAITANPALATSGAVGQKQHEFLMTVNQRTRQNGMQPNVAVDQAMTAVAEGARYDHISRQKQAAAVAVKDKDFVAQSAKTALATTVEQAGFYTSAWRHYTGQQPNPAINFIPESLRSGPFDILGVTGELTYLTVNKLDVSSDPDFQAEFTPAFERRLAETKGDAERAAILALSDVARVAGYSEFAAPGGGLTFTRYPIEQTTGLSADQIRASLLEDVQEIDKQPSLRSAFTETATSYIEDGNFRLTPNELALQNNQKAWDIWVPAENGQWRMVNPATAAFQPAAKTKRQEQVEREASEITKELPGAVRGIATDAVGMGIEIRDSVGSALDGLFKKPAQ